MLLISLHSLQDADVKAACDTRSISLMAAAVHVHAGTIETGVADVPTVAEFEARTLVAADYTVVADLPAAAPTAADDAEAVCG